MGWRTLLVGVAVLAGCVDMPRDPDNTLERVKREHRFTVGAVAPSPTDLAVVGRVAEATGARPVVRQGQLEPLLLALEAGDLDLVVGGRFSADTPWKARVTLGPPLDEVTVGDAAHRAHVVARNGENAWITLVQRAAKAEGAK